jgi:maltooligosyltrehalose trehalohydrolase
MRARRRFFSSLITGTSWRAVRDGRRREFASFPQFSDPAVLQKIPDPNARETFGRSKPLADADRAESRQNLYRRLLMLRRQHIVPRLTKIRALDAQAVASAAVSARWYMGDGATLTLACNLGPEAAAIDPIRNDFLFATSHAAQGSAREGRLEAYSTLALMVPQ